MKNSIVPKFVFSDNEKLFINENISHKNCKVTIGKFQVLCYEFKEDEDTVFEKVFVNSICEIRSDKPNPEDRAFATRASTIAFQAIRDLNSINGANLIELAKGIKALGRISALAVCVALANLDMMFARRLLPLIRAI